MRNSASATTARKAISAGLGYSTGQISANAFWAKRDQPYKHLGSNRNPGGEDGRADGTREVGYSGLGFDLSYTVGASTLTMVYAKTELSDIQPEILLFTSYATSANFKSMGAGFSHDLGGGASLVAGFGKVPRLAVGDLGVGEIGQMVRTDRRVDISGDRNVASVACPVLLVLNRTVIEIREGAASAAPFSLRRAATGLLSPKVEHVRFPWLRNLVRQPARCNWNEPSPHSEWGQPPQRPDPGGVAEQGGPENPPPMPGQTRGTPMQCLPLDPGRTETLTCACKPSRFGATASRRNRWIGEAGEMPCSRTIR